MARRGRPSPSDLRRRGWVVTGYIFRRGKSYVVVIDHGRSESGKKIRKWHTFKTRPEAEAFQLSAATHPTFSAGVGVYGSMRQRLGPYLERWLGDYANGRVKTSTFKRYAELVRVHLIPSLGHVQMSRLSPQAIERFYRELAGCVSPTTAHHVAGMLHGSLKQAIKWGIIIQNPADLVEKPKRARYTPVLWTADQARQFINAARGQRHFLLYAMLITTGLRLGEALGLQWADVDLSRGTLLVREGKTASARRAVLMPEELVRELKAIRGVGPVFPRANPWTIRKCYFYPLIEQLGLPRIRLHDLRHLHATFLLSGGVDIATVSARLGHSSKAFTLQTYTHATALGQEMAARVAGPLLAQPEGRKRRKPAPVAVKMVPPAGFEPALPA